MEKKYKIAGIVLSVSGAEEVMYQEDGVLAPFVTVENNWDYKLEFEIVTELSKSEGMCVFRDSGKRVYSCDKGEVRYIGAVNESLDGAYMRILRQENRSLIQVKRSKWSNCITPKIVLNAMTAEHFIVQNRGFLLHSSYICWNGKGILFTAPSGTGKSTQADLWHKFRGAEILNGDRSAVKVEQDGIFVHGIPFSGSSGIGKNRKCPLVAIVYLSQAPTTSISRLTGVRAFRRIWEGCSVNTWNREDVSMCTQTVMDVINRVPIFYLPCTPDETAIIALEQELNKVTM